MKAPTIGLGEMKAFKSPGLTEPEPEPAPGQDFAAMLGPRPSAATPPRPKPPAPPAPPPAPRERAEPAPSDDANAAARAEARRRDSATAQARPEAAAHEADDASGAQDPPAHAAAGDRPGAAPARRGPRAADDEGRENGDTATAATAAGAPGEHPGEARPGPADAAPGAWPPAGLAGLGLTPAPGAAPALPGVSAAGQPGALPEAIAGAGARPLLMQAVAASGGPAAGAGPAPGQPGALPAFAAALAQKGGEAAQQGLPQTQALAALAGSADAPAAGGELKAPDPGGVLLQGAAPAHVAAARGPDAAVFDASPTPTPHLHGEDFDDAIGARMNWLADQKIGHAHIKITPNDMGPVEVRLQLDGDKVNASFTSAHAEVRQALEQSLPRLRDMLGQHGFQLGQADVGQQHQNPGNARAGSGFAAEGNAGGDELGAPVAMPASLLRQRGLLDAYA